MLYQVCLGIRVRDALEFWRNYNKKPKLLRLVANFILKSIYNPGKIEFDVKELPSGTKPFGIKVIKSGHITFIVYT